MDDSTILHGRPRPAPAYNGAYARARAAPAAVGHHVNADPVERDCHGRARAGRTLQSRGQGGRVDLRIGNARPGRGRRDRRQGRRRCPDPPGHRAHARDPCRLRLLARAGGFGDGLHQAAVGFRRDERGLPRLLDDGPAGTHDDRQRPRSPGCAGRDIDDRGAERRRARRHPPVRLGQVAEPVQLRHPHRRHVVSRRPGIAQRPRQQRRARRRDGADDDGARQCRRAAEGGGDVGTRTSSARGCTCRTWPVSSR